MSDEFVVGDLVTPIHSSGGSLTMGKVYEVVKYDPPFPNWTSTWPAYVEVIDERGKLVVAPARRFKLA